MTYKILIYSIQVSILIIEATSNLLQPQYSVKVFNTETVNLSLGDSDDVKNNDLEIIKASPGKSALDKKMSKFHKYVNLIEMTESPEEKFSFGKFSKFKNYSPLLSISYPDSQLPEDENQMDKPRARKKKRKKKRLRTMNFRQFKKNQKIKKRQVTKEKEYGDTDDEIHYEYLEKEYLDFVNQSFMAHQAFKYSDEGKPEENFREVIYKITDVKTPKNCSEITGIGLQALECIVKNFRSGQLDEKEMIYAISVILLIWFGVYLAITLPLWCLKGWCCCCFRCEICFPRKTVSKIQKYITQNPPGIYLNSEDEEERYNPTQRETELYEQLKRSIAEF